MTSQVRNLRCRSIGVREATDLIRTQLCKVQKYLVKNFQNFDLARFKCMSRKISRDDLYQNTSQINP